MPPSTLFPFILVLSTLHPLTSASISHESLHYARSIVARTASVPTTLPGNWTSLGCYTDQAGGVRALTGSTYTNTTGMSVESCINFCSTQSKPYIYAGVEYGQECYCGNAFAGTNANTTLSSCSMTCTGNKSETCGAGNRLNVFWSGTLPPPPPATVPSVGNWTSLGCYNDTSAARALPVMMGTAGSVSIESCTTACFNAGYPLSGAEYASECYCGNSLGHGSVSAPLTDCSMTCAGNSSEFCGGSARLNVYNYTGTNLPPQSSTGGGGGGGTTPPVTTSPVFTVSADLLPTGWAYNSCWIDNANGRILTTQLSDNKNLTVESCVSACGAQNYTLAGVEYATQCFCGHSLLNGAAMTSTGCTMGCGGNGTEACGGGARMSVYTSTPGFVAYPVPKIQRTGLPPNWNYTGCYTENSTTGNLPYKITWTSNNTVGACLSQCAAYGYPVAGLEYGQECWCGDQVNIQQGTGSFAEDNTCQQACSGDPTAICGNPGKLSLYTYQGGLYTWHTPESTGRYEYLIGGLVVPLVATVGLNNKVTFLEKSGTSPFTNSTGAYELDLSLINDPGKAWRTMHVESDVFCSASLVLPDKAGRVINIGGWSLDSTKGIRLYMPDGSDGVNGTNDWQENWGALHLQRQRWYPSAVTLANGSILVMGGETGSNGPPEGSLEVLPEPSGGPSWKFLPWLNRTDPNNLYPFLMVLPSMNVFVGYYNEARVLDPLSFDTVVVLPNMPGNVNNPAAGRSYPMEGSAVLMPQYAPYTDPVEIMVCGGSTPVEGTGLDSCVTIAPEVPNATWVYERMPSKRVMPCMAALPDGTYLIVNGAHQGHAGFNLASSPNLNALLYDPAQPVHSRFSILNNTIVARLYHSEATLLPDGRVLISGSDPSDTATGGTYPEEFRIEVYVPPYLASGAAQPAFSVPETDWAYGGTYALTNVTLFQGDASTLRVSLVAATSSTHGNTMGGCTLFPAVSCNGAGGCTVTAPPNAGVCPPGWFQLFVLDGPTPSHSQWVRIGGDPSQLGNWPNLPGFAVPGV